ncbi:MAG TPA: hypothetical protein VGZ27_09285 [Vicinamibacterales bacterium]|jgi:hypothetical protein|nr:hypothetical protein [Vicinamibacterales bacterium]
MKFTTSALVLAGGLACAAPTFAQARVELVPSVSFSSTYDNNLFATQNASRDEMLLVTPSLEGYYESPSVRMQSSYSFDAQRAVGHSVLNMLEARRHGMVETSLKMSPQFRVSFDGRYDLSQSPNELNFETNVLLGRQRSTRWQLTPALEYQLRPRTVVTAQYDFTKEAMAQYVDGQMQVIRVGFDRKQTPLITWGIKYLGRRFANGAGAALPLPTPFGSLNATVVPQSIFNLAPMPVFYSIPAMSQQSQAVLGEVTWTVGPETSFMVQAGPRISSYGSRMPEVLSTFAKQTRLTKIGLDYWQGETIVLGIPGPVKLESSTARVVWAVRRTVEVGAHAGVFHIETLQKAAARVFHTELVGSWSPGGPYTLAASYGMDFQKGDVRSPLLSEKQVVRHVFLVRMTVAPRLSRYTKPRDPNDPASKGDSK